MKKFLKFILEDNQFKLTYFELILLPISITLSIFTGNTLILIPSVILIFVLNKILKELLEEEK